MVRYFIEGLESDKFNAICRCTLENAIGIIVKHSRKKHAFLILDEVNRLSNERSAENPSSPFHILMARISGLIDKAKEPRVNFLCSSLASIPIRDMETLSGRRYQVSN